MSNLQEECGGNFDEMLIWFQHIWWDAIISESKSIKYQLSFVILDDKAFYCFSVMLDERNCTYSIHSLKLLQLFTRKLLSAQGNNNVQVSICLFYFRVKYIKQANSASKSLLPHDLIRMRKRPNILLNNKRNLFTKPRLCPLIQHLNYIWQTVILNLH